MATTILTRIYHRIVAATLRHINAAAAYRRTRSWRRETLRAMRKRSRE